MPTLFCPPSLILYHKVSLFITAFCTPGFSAKQTCTTRIPLSALFVNQRLLCYVTIVPRKAILTPSVPLQFVLQVSNNSQGYPHMHNVVFMAKRHLST